LESLSNRLFLYGLASLVIVLIGTLSLIVPVALRNAEQAASARQTALVAADLNATLDSRLAIMLGQVSREQTAQAIIAEVTAIWQAQTATYAAVRATAERLISEATAEAERRYRTATAAPQQTQTAYAQATATPQAQTAIAVAQQTATAEALGSAALATRSAQVATLSAAETAIVQAQSQRTATAAALATRSAEREAALRNAAPLSVENATALTELLSLKHDAPITALAISPDSRLAVGLARDQLLIWSLRDGALLQRMAYGGIAINSFAIAPDSRAIALALDDGTLALWRLGERAPRLAKAHSAPIFRVVYSPDGRLLATAAADQTVIWAAAELKVLARLNGWAWDAAFSNGGRYVITTSDDGSLHLWGVPVYK